MSSSSSSSSRTSSKPLIIFCHGSGDTGPGAQQWIQALVPPSVLSQFDWIFPTAEPLPYSLAGGQPMHVWFDRTGGFEPKHAEQTASVEPAASRLIKIVEREIQEHNRRPSQVAIGGFSMGGGIALQTAARWHSDKSKPKLGAVFAMSSYLAHDSRVWTLLKEAKQQRATTHWPPTFMAHGAYDDFILPQWGEATFDRLQEQGVPMAQKSLQRVPHTQHEMAPTEVSDLVEFLDQTLNVNEEPNAQSTTKGSEL